MANSNEVRAIIDKLIDKATNSDKVGELKEIAETAKQYVQIYDFLIAKEKMDAVSYTTKEPPIITEVPKGFDPKHGN